ncbi:MAG TPA: ATP-dependent helicase [Candidatus Desulfofervidus auxilii]|uniref:DNA 3'-5' helicase n=1 Tax=Desulfofervidus auxilii TaxID=1621989 RepID=A0A7C0Y407_DESA2|nr:ATP-dependent helicase [Candidatus Desulfofervidus auxilii]
MDIKKLLKDNLNPAQYEAVTTIDGPILVVAGAGTGKTRVIEYRVLYLVSKGISPQSILLLTFTRRAAREMLSRAARHNKLCEYIYGGTFHSFGFSIISEFATALGYKRPISFLDEADSEEIIYRLAIKLGYTEKKKRFPTKTTLKSVISASFNRGESIENVLLKDYPHFLHLAKNIEHLKEEYVKYKINHNLLDYDDLLIYLRLLLLKEPIRKRLSERFRYIMVDEFQDTNKIQAEIVYLLGKEHKNVMAVGDDAQSIYGFRGARYENMFEFLDIFPKAKIIKLEENYRSTQPILNLANAVIERAKKKYTKVLVAKREEKEKPKLFIFKDPQNEAEWVAEKIIELRNEGIPLHHIGVLFRSLYLGRPLEIALSKRLIPYKVYGGIRFIETAHIKDLISHIKIIANPLDELAWQRVLMLIEGIGPKTADKIINEIIKNGNFKEVLFSFSKNPRYGIGIKKLFEALKEASIERLSVAEIVSILSDYYMPILERKYDDYQRRASDIESLKQIAMGYKSIETFLVELIAIEPAEKSIDDITTLYEDEQPVILSTIHSAKGLEWDIVFIIGLADGHFPVSHNVMSEEELEEERRLFYVAITRAKTKLYLSVPHRGYRGGITIFNRLCRFLDDGKILKLLDVSEKDYLFEDYELAYDKEELLRKILEEL